MTSSVTSIPVPGPMVGSPERRAADSDRSSRPYRFVIGRENRLAEVAVCNLLEGSFHRFNPLVLYGVHGVGKSHLVRGLASLWEASEARGEALYTTAADFARDFAMAVNANLVETFRRRHRTVSLWVMEDLGNLGSKHSAQQELIHTLDTLLDTDARVVVTSRLPLTETPRLCSALVSRLSAGLVISLSPPGRAARLEILRDLAATRHIILVAPVAELLAEKITGTAFDLSAALAELQVASKQTGGSVNIALTRRYLADREVRSRLLPSEIITLVAKYFSLKQTVLRSKSRTQSVVLARGVAMYLARRLTTQSLQQIGRCFGGRDHTTVLHHCRKIERLLQNNPSVRRAVDDLWRLLNNNLAKK